MPRKRANGEGTLFEKRPGLWCGQITLPKALPTDKAHRRTIYGRTQKECREKMDLVKEEARQGLGVSVVGQSQTLQQLITWWLESTASRVADSTLKRYELDCSYLLAEGGDVLVSDLTGERMTTIVSRISRRGRDKAAKARSRLNQILRQAARSGILNTSARLWTPPVQTAPATIQPLSEEQVRAFLAAAKGDKLEALYRLALDSGARWGELAALEWDDWNLGDRTVRINKALKSLNVNPYPGKTKTGSGRRTVVVTTQTAGSIEATRNGRTSGPIFCTSRGTYLRNSNVRLRSFQPLLEKAGLPEMKFHSLRHTCATLLLRAGVDVVTVAARLGHVDPAVTLRTYSHCLSDGQERAAAAMEGVLSAGENG